MHSKRKKPVHLTFKAHVDGETFRSQPLADDVKTFVLEDASGRELNEQVEILHDRSTTYSSGAKEFVDEARAAGKEVVAGETFRSPGDRELYERLSKSSNEAMKAAWINPVADCIRDYFVKRAEWDAFRHKLIRQTIGSASKEGPLEAQYGTGHSTLSAELSAVGIDSSRDMGPLVFPHDTCIIRKLVRGKDPMEISDREYKAGFVSMIMPDDWASLAFCGKSLDVRTDSDSRFEILVRHALVDRLTEQQLDEVLWRDDFKLVMTFNGLPNPLDRTPTPEEVRDFLDRNSRERPKSVTGIFWKRLRGSSRV
ncbi:MAG: hypothetical protein GF416_00520 [Candidatus Altiarchaeales archaeon]|nr:hypothetical protein [Candidatus Altiarchaeales archaeon]MBD3415602.1 hypothetical protein [Candidatus Altiarchaeales archaeon]